MGEASLRLSGLVFQPLDLAHGIGAADNYDVGIVYETVNDGFGQCGFADFLVLAAHLKLRTENSGRLFVAAFGVFQGIQQPFVQNQQLKLLVLL